MCMSLPWAGTPIDLRKAFICVYIYMYIYIYIYIYPVALRANPRHRARNGSQNDKNFQKQPSKIKSKSCTIKA